MHREYGQGPIRLMHVSSESSRCSGVRHHGGMCSPFDSAQTYKKDHAEIVKRRTDQMGNAVQAFMHEGYRYTKQNLFTAIEGICSRANTEGHRREGPQTTASSCLIPALRVGLPAAPAVKCSSKLEMDEGFGPWVHVFITGPLIHVKVSRRENMCC